MCFHGEPLQARILPAAIGSLYTNSLGISQTLHMWLLSAETNGKTLTSLDSHTAHGHVAAAFQLQLQAEGLLHYKALVEAHHSRLHLLSKLWQSILCIKNDQQCLTCRPSGLTIASMIGMACCRALPAARAGEAVPGMLVIHAPLSLAFSSHFACAVLVL